MNMDMDPGRDKQTPQRHTNKDKRENRDLKQTLMTRQGTGKERGTQVR